MATTVPTRYEIEVKDIEYLRHGDKPLLARLYAPKGKGPFPLIVEVHGGIWCLKDRMTDVGTNEPLARNGIAALAIDFRMPPQAGYPASMADLNYAIRWCKARAAELGTRPDTIGVLGVSSGGHQAILAAMRPNDPRYTSVPLRGAAATNATVRCAVLCWPVIDPLGRYHYARKAKQDGNVKLAGEDVNEWISCHDKYWGSEAAMSEGSPTLALERGEKVAIPPVLYLQGTSDEAHPRDNLQRFVDGYRKAGGKVDLHWYEGMPHAFITKDPQAPASLAAIEKIIEFVHREMPVN